MLTTGLRRSCAHHGRRFLSAFRWRAWDRPPPMPSLYDRSSRDRTDRGRGRSGVRRMDPVCNSLRARWRIALPLLGLLGLVGEPAIAQMSDRPGELADERADYFVRDSDDTLHLVELQTVGIGGGASRGRIRLKVQIAGSATSGSGQMWFDYLANQPPGYEYSGAIRLVRSGGYQHTTWVPGACLTDVFTFSDWVLSRLPEYIDLRWSVEESRWRYCLPSELFEVLEPYYNHMLPQERESSGYASSNLSGSWNWAWGYVGPSLLNACGGHASNRNTRMSFIRSGPESVVGTDPEAPGWYCTVEMGEDPYVPGEDVPIWTAPSIDDPLPAFGWKPLDPIAVPPGGPGFAPPGTDNEPWKDAIESGMSALRSRLGLDGTWHDMAGASSYGNQDVWTFNFTHMPLLGPLTFELDFGQWDAQFILFRWAVSASATVWCLFIIFDHLKRF